MSHFTLSDCFCREQSNSRHKYYRHWREYRLACVCLALLLPTASRSQICLAVTPPESAFDQLLDAYFDAHFEIRPTDATAAGLHQYDHLLEDYSKAAVAQHVATLAGFLQRSDAIRWTRIPQSTESW